jgi:soluble lytic murein transglycosylase-like protein
MSDTTGGGGNFLGMDPQTARNLLAFGASAMQAANARTPQGFLANGAGPLGPIGAGLQGMMQNQYAQQQLGSEAALRNAQAQQIGLQNQITQMGLPYQQQLMQMRQRMLQDPSILQQIYGGQGGQPASSTQSPGITSPSIVPVEQRAGLISDAVKGTNVPPEIMGSVIDQESNWNVNSVSPTGARGLSQIMPSTAQNPGYGLAGVNPETLDGPGGVASNLKLGAQYLGALGKSVGLNSSSDWALNPDLATRALSMYYSGSANPTVANNNYASSVLGRAQAGWSGSANPAPYRVAQAGNQLVPAPASTGGPTGPRMVPLPGAMSQQQGIPLTSPMGQPMGGGGMSQGGMGGGGNISLPPAAPYQQWLQQADQADAQANQIEHQRSMAQMFGMPIPLTADPAALRQRAQTFRQNALQYQNEQGRPQTIRPGGAQITPQGITQSQVFREMMGPDGRKYTLGMNPVDTGNYVRPPGVPDWAPPGTMSATLEDYSVGEKADIEHSVEQVSKEGTESFTAAKNTQGWLQQMDHAADALNQAGGFLSMGPSSPERIAFASNVNDALRVIGVKAAFDPNAIGSWEELKKATTTAGFELSSHYEGHARQAATTIMNATAAVPSAQNSPVGYRYVSAGVNEAAQSAIDLYQAQIAGGAYQRPGGYEKATTDFQTQFPPAMYARRAISTVKPYTVSTSADANRFLPGTYVRYQGRLLQVPARPGAPPIPDYIRQMAPPQQ